MDRDEVMDELMRYFLPNTVGLMPRPYGQQLPRSANIEDRRGQGIDPLAQHVTPGTSPAEYIRNNELMTQATRKNLFGDPSLSTMEERVPSPISAQLGFANVGNGPRPPNTGVMPLSPEQQLQQQTNAQFPQEPQWLRDIFIQEQMETR